MKGRAGGLLALVLLATVALAGALPEHRVTTVRVAIFAATAVAAAELVRAAAAAVPPPSPSPLQRRRARPSRASGLPHDYGAIVTPVRLLHRGSVDASLAAGRFGVVLRSVAAHRLARARGLDLDDPADADAAREALGDDLWATLQLLERRRPGERRPVRLDLDHVLDRLDRL